MPHPLTAAPHKSRGSLSDDQLGNLAIDWGSWLMLPTVVALLAVWRRGAAWLAVPAVWPFTQLHYASLALPVAARNPLVAFLLCFPVAFLPAVATIAYAGGVVVGGRLSTARASTTTSPTHAQ